MIKVRAQACQLEPRMHRTGGRHRPLSASWKRWLRVSLCWLPAILGTGSSPGMAERAQPRFTVLVFSKTTAFRHDSIPQGIAAIRDLAADHDFAVDSTEDAARFTDAELGRYRVVVFLSTTGDILDSGQKAAFERFVRSGGGFVGIHSASDTEYRWAWYG